jgi:hypothetical protein
MSARSEAAARFVEFVTQHGLDRVFGGDNGYGEGKKYRSILFDRPALLDGSIRVYNPKFILIDSGGPLGLGREAFDDVDNALAYLRAAFVERDLDAADKVPRKPAK